MSETTRHVVLLSCTKTKRDQELPAFLLYSASPWFRAMWKLALEQATDPHNDIFILSAKHGLVHPLTCIEPYEAELPNGRTSRTVWAAQVLNALLKHLDHDRATEFWFLTGWRYRDPLEDWLYAGNMDRWFCHHPFGNVQGIQAQIAAADERRELLVRLYGGKLNKVPQLAIPSNIAWSCP